MTLWPEDLLPEHKFKPALLLQQGHADAVTAVVRALRPAFVLNIQTS